MSSLPLVLVYLMWEAGVVAVCLAAVVRFRPLSMRLPLFLSLHIMVNALSAAVLSHARWNSKAAYQALAVVFLAAGASLARKRLRSTGRQLATLLRPSPQALAVWFGLGCLLALSIRPVEEVDSFYNLHYIIGWVNNVITPYTSAYNYAPLWDLSSVPALVLTRSDLFFWFNSLIPVLLLAVTLWRIARELRLTNSFAVWSVAALLTFPHLWLGPSGISTNKNDMLNAAGYALLALTATRWVRGRAGRADVVAAGLATAFISVKASGPVMMLLSGLAVCLVAGNRIRRSFKPAMTAAAVVGLLWFAGSGHYYLNNYLTYGSPVYPHQINFGPLHLPGRADLRATSILYSLGYPDVWRLLFLPQGGFSPDGVLFPVILAAILSTSAWWAASALVRRRMGVAEVLAVFQLLAWGVYFRSVYSAGASPGDLVFLRSDLNSTRFIEGPLLVGALCLVCLLDRLGTPRAVTYLLLAAQAGSCFLILLRRAPDRPWAVMAACGLGLALGSLCLRWRPRLAGGAALLTLSLVAGAYLVERRRPLWLPWIQPLYQPLYDAPAQELFYIIDDEFSPQVSWHWPMLGRRLQHSSESGSRAALAAREKEPLFVAWIQETPDMQAPKLPGYEAVVTVPRGVLLRRK